MCKNDRTSPYFWKFCEVGKAFETVETQKPESSYKWYKKKEVRVIVISER